MAVPKQVRKQIRRGEKAFEQFNAPQGEGQSQEVQEPSEPSETVEAVEETPLPAGQADATEKQEAASAEPVVEPSEPSEPAEPAESSEDIDWASRYRVLQGKYNAEVPTLAQQNRGLAEQVQKLTEQVTTLQNQLLSHAQPANAAADAPTNGASPTYGTENDRDEFGGDLMDAMGRVAKAVVGDQFEKLSTQLDNVTSKIDQVGSRQEQTEQDRAVSARSQMFTYLAEHVPEWEALNNDQAFLDWLGQMDPLAGRRRQDMLDDAFDKNDGPRVTEFFTRFKAENAVVAPSTPSPAPEPTRQPPVRMEDLAAPRTQAGASSAQQEKRLWKRSEIQAFYTEVSRGAYKNREKERNALERDIIAAQAEGRIVDPPRA